MVWKVIKNKEDFKIWRNSRNAIEVWVYKENGKWVVFENSIANARVIWTEKSKSKAIKLASGYRRRLDGRY